MHSCLYKVYSLVGEELLSDMLQGEEVDVSGPASGQYIFVLEGEDNEVLRTRLLAIKRRFSLW